MVDEPIDIAAAREQTLEVIRKEVRDQVHRGELPAVRWGQQFRFFREEVLAVVLNRPAGPDEAE